MLIGYTAIYKGNTYNLGGCPLIYDRTDMRIIEGILQGSSEISRLPFSEVEIYFDGQRVTNLKEMHWYPKLQRT
jgi:hypothetical protein